MTSYSLNFTYLYNYQGFMVQEKKLLIDYYFDDQTTKLINLYIKFLE